MGMSRSVYVGAYLELTLKQVKTQTKRRVCPNHGQVGDVRFCPQCGERIIDGTDVVVKFPSIWAIVGDDFEDSFVWSIGSESGGMARLVSNYDDGTRVEIDDDNLCVDISSLGGAVDYFTEKFRTQIAHIKAHEGVERIDIKLGVVQFYS